MASNQLPRREGLSSAWGSCRRVSQINPQMAENLVRYPFTEAVGRSQDIMRYPDYVKATMMRAARASRAPTAFSWNVMAMIHSISRVTTFRYALGLPRSPSTFMEINAGCTGRSPGITRLRQEGIPQLHDEQTRHHWLTDSSIEYKT